MTQPVAVVTDTTHYLPRALADMQEIHQVSLYVGWEDELERELEMSGFERFYERGSGVELKEVAARVHEARQVLKIRFCIDTLEYLQRGGRIGRAQAWLGITMKIKPILSFEREITPVARVRTAGRAFEHLVEYMREMRRDGADGWAVQHIRAPDQAERLVERGREIYGCEPPFASEGGPGIGTYIGPGGLLLAGIPRAAVA